MEIVSLLLPGNTTREPSGLSDRIEFQIRCEKVTVPTEYIVQYAGARQFSAPPQRYGTTCPLPSSVLLLLYPSCSVELTEHKVSYKVSYKVYRIANQGYLTTLEIATPI
jgi:hypothetical protein